MVLEISLVVWDSGVPLEGFCLQNLVNSSEMLFLLFCSHPEQSCCLYTVIYYWTMWHWCFTSNFLIMDLHPILLYGWELQLLTHWQQPTHVTHKKQGRALQVLISGQPVPGAKTELLWPFLAGTALSRWHWAGAHPRSRKETAQLHKLITLPQKCNVTFCN